MTKMSNRGSTPPTKKTAFESRIPDVCWANKPDSGKDLKGSYWLLHFRTPKGLVTVGGVTQRRSRYAGRQEFFLLWMDLPQAS